jgi:hypothetical protein
MEFSFGQFHIPGFIASMHLVLQVLEVQVAMAHLLADWAHEYKEILI